MKTEIIYKQVGAFGGSAFRAVRRGDLIVIQESVRGARWRDIAKTTPSEFYKYADRFDLFNLYENNPANLWKIAGKICSECY